MTPRTLMVLCRLVAVSTAPVVREGRMAHRMEPPSPRLVVRVEWLHTAPLGFNNPPHSPPPATSLHHPQRRKKPENPLSLHTSQPTEVRENTQNNPIQAEREYCGHPTRLFRLTQFVHPASPLSLFPPFPPFFAALRANPSSSIFHLPSPPFFPSSSPPSLCASPRATELSSVRAAFQDTHL